MPKPEPKAINEASQVVRPEKVVNWLSIKLEETFLRQALWDLGKEQHVLTRCPRFNDLYQQVQWKMQEPAIAAYAQKYNLTVWEAECILACPRRALQHAPNTTPAQHHSHP